MVLVPSYFLLCWTGSAANICEYVYMMKLFNYVIELRESKFMFLVNEIVAL